ncbi:unnamed protein product [Mycena citricolor]|uniref:Zn(2)-C6 fungal-type domain-containing protein n=1 Tax=Mycena citricolor TaxID=2018698 RepID=A0AAD2K6M2_9AGAR|nr:unnamed protein product [Mycena citricolor]
MSVFASSRRVAIACLSCRERKIKCITSSTDNACLRCHSNDLPCDYISAVKHRRVRPAPADTDAPRKRRTARPDAPSGPEAPARTCALRPLRAKHAPYPRHHRAYDGAAEGCWPVVADVAEYSVPPRPCAYPPSICISERDIRQPIPLSSVSCDYDWAPPSRSPSASPIALPLPLPLSSASSSPLLTETREAFVYSHVSQVDDPLEDYWRAFDGGASWHPSHAQEFIGVQLPDAYTEPATLKYATACASLSIHPQASIYYTPQLFDVITTGLPIHNASLSPRISWDSKTADILPGWGLMDPVANRESTIPDLMSHCTGLAPHEMMGALADPVEGLRLRHLRPSYAFRAHAVWFVRAAGRPASARHARYGVLLRPGAAGQVGGWLFMPQAIWLRALLEEVENAENETIIPAEVIEKAASEIMVYSPIARYPELSPLTYGGGQSRGTYRGFEVIEHGGLTPGFLSQISRIPSQSLGVAVLTNDDSLGNFMMEAIKYRIFDEYFGLAPVEWTARFDSTPFRTSQLSLSIATASDRPTASTAPYATLAGTYTNAAYRDLRLRLFLHGSMEEGDGACEDLAAEVGARLPAVIQPHVPTLIARWATPLTHYLLLEHFDRDPWNLTGLWSHCEGEWVQKMTVGMLAELDGARGFVGRAFSGSSEQDRGDVGFERPNRE